MNDRQDAWAIVIEASTSLQRDQIQAFIKKEANSWWHGLDDLWIVIGKSGAEWRDSLSAFFPTAGAGSVMVLKVDTDSSKTWSFQSGTFTESQKKWLQDNL